MALRGWTGAGIVVSDVAIVGAGRIGSVFARLMPEAAVVRRGAVIPPAACTILCVGEDDLPAAWAALPAPASVGEGVVVLQNGLVGPWLAARLPDPVIRARVTRGVLNFAAPARDGAAIPGGTSVFFGPEATRVVTILIAGGIPARVATDAADFARVEATKLAWTCAFGLLGTVHGCTVGEVLAHHGAALDALLAELTPVLAGAAGVALDAEGLRADVRAYAAGIPGWSARLKALDWRNGAVVRAARAQGRPSAAHEGLLARAGVSVA